MSITIAMIVGSVESTKFLVKRSVETIIANLGTEDYLLVIGITPIIHPEIISMLIDFAQKSESRIIVTGECCETYATFANHVIQTYARKSKWFLLSHDDIELTTKKFLPKVEKELKNKKEDVGWIGFTDIDYLNGHWAPPTRPGYFTDFLDEGSWEDRTMFQFHRLRKMWPKKCKSYTHLDYDFPKKSVKCHAPYSHFVLIETEKLLSIGLCENWSPVSLLIDEDWGLRALQKNLVNIWMPDINYLHCRKDGTRAAPLISKYSIKCATSFYNKWGFVMKFPGRHKAMRYAVKVYSHTNIPFSVGRRSYEWEYLV